MPGFSPRPAYLRPFRDPGRPRPPTAAPSRAGGPGGARVGAAARCGFDCFGFFGSRLDRLCPFAIVGSFSVDVPNLGTAWATPGSLTVSSGSSCALSCESAKICSLKVDRFRVITMDFPANHQNRRQAEAPSIFDCSLLFKSLYALKAPAAGSGANEIAAGT
jgi:hypothetical protein